jgi:hypothetical protein
MLISPTHPTPISLIKIHNILTIDPTLTLQIPFTLLGRTDVLDASTWWSRKKRYTDPVRDVYTALQKFCPHIGIEYQSRNAPPLQTSKWILRPVAEGEEDTLNADEKARLGKKVWHCPMVLQRTGICLAVGATDWAGFVKEVKEIFEVLGRTFVEFKNRIPRQREDDEAVRWWSLICPSSSYLHISLVPAAPPARVMRPGTLGLETVKKVLMVFAGVEKELTTLSTPAALLEFWSLSRFLELRGIRQMGKEKARLWRDLKGKEWSERMEGRMYARGKEKWLAGFEDEDLECQRTRGRRREWWDVVDGIDEEQTQQLVREMAEFEQTGRKLGLSCDIIEDNVLRNSPTPYQLAQPLNLDISSLNILAHRSTLNPDSLLAYTELVASLLQLALKRTPASLARWLEAFRASTQALPDQPLYGFTKLLKELGISEESRTSLSKDLDPIFLHTNTKQRYPSVSLHIDPFAPIRQHINYTLQRERDHIPEFVERYDRAGGFHPTPSRKLYALLQQDEQNRKVKKVDGTKKAEGWLDGLRDAWVEDAREIELELEEDREGGRKTPEMSEEERNMRMGRVWEALGLYCG